MQTTLLGLAIAFIIALVAALIGPYFIDWNQFRPQFEAEATRVIGAQVRFAGKLDARLLPAPSLHLRSVVVGGANDLGKVRADKLDVEFSLGSLMRGELRATELTVNGMALDLGLDPQGRIDWPASTGKFNLGSLAIDRLNLTGRIALHDAASRGTLELNDIAFSGDVRSLAGSVRGDGAFAVSGTRYPFRVSSGQTADGNGTRVHLNIDPGARALSADLDGVLSFDGRAPRFEGALVLAAPAGLKASGDVAITPWRIAAKGKADPSAARLEQIEAAYGPEDSALRLTGAGDIRFGASPLLRATLSAKQLDADKFAAKGNGAAEPVRLLPGLRSLMAAIPQATPIPAQIEFSAEQIMLGGRPLQGVAAALQAGAKDLNAKAWAIDRLEFRAPGATRVTLSGSNAQAGSFTGALSVDSSDPDALVTWLQGRTEVVYRSQKPLRLRGDLTVAPDRVAIEAMKAEIDGGAVEGRVEVSTAPGGSRIDAELKAERLDLDAATALARSLAGPQAKWPDEARLTLDIGRAISAGQELRPLLAKVGYGPKSFALEQLKIGQASQVMLEGAGSFDRVNTSGKLTLNSSAASLGQITALIAPLAPALAARINAMGAGPGPARLKLSLDLDKTAQQADRANARAVFDLDAPQLKGVVTIVAKPVITALHGIDLAALGRSEFSLESRMSSGQGRPLLAALGLDRAVAAGDGPAQFEGSVTGVWRAPLRLKVKMSGTGLDAEAEGTAEPWAAEPKASVNLKVRSADLGPLLDLKASDTLARNIGLSARVSLAGNRLAFDDLDSTIAGSRLRGRLALVLGDEKNVEGEIGLDTLDLAPAFALAIGAAGHDAAEPLGSGFSKGWRGRVAFQALRGALPGGGELRPVSGVLKGDGQSVSFEAITGSIGGGEASTNIDVRQTGNGIALNARVQLSGVDGAALRYRGLKMPAGRASMQMTLASQGRSASALTGALSGSGTVTLESAAIAGLDPRAFDAAIRASDGGQATDDIKLRQIVERVLSAGSLSVKSAQIPFSIGDGRIRIGATTLDAEGARAVVSGGYDIPADQADIRASLASTAVGSASSRPEVQLFAAGPPDALDRTIDVAALSSWLAVRAIDRETRRLDAIERGEPPPPFSASLPPATTAPSGTPDAVLPGLPTSEVPIPGRDPRRPPPPPKPKAAIPRPPAAPPAPGAATPSAAAPAAAAPPAPVASQQAAPLPPPIEVRPAPGSAVARPPKLRPPLVLTPPQ
ncbi:MAG: AsmA-like C-terminal region-containing protein [Bradyrhizobium sp.]|uniref:AsmA family protein n=1 Tax=Bradyrhizobium sp. TaxID=376 RepID=UPI00272631FA|nr:AsmA-like C-terminal region-containing protein [Bradyrhizobium sp.]MDO8396836.1 AsmA-like C-terminal region-containing protein [Bradyrhizobium sp.]